MMNGWTAPAVAIVLLIQGGAAVWWASGTDTEVKNNTSAIEQVVENEKQIAVVQTQQATIVKDIDEIKLDNKELKEMTQEILNKLDN
tara:strand:+ start:1102 stop:1362 length:261 start_codon:yes stop_codon:yes gene_type:complete